MVVAASAAERPYIHWLFFCAGLQGERLLRCVNRAEAVFARVVQVMHQAHPRPDKFPKTVFALLIKPLQRPEKIIDRLQAGMLLWIAADDVDRVFWFYAEVLFVNLFRLSQRGTQRGGWVAPAARGENHLKMIGLMKRRLEKLADQLVVRRGFWAARRKGRIMAENWLDVARDARQAANRLVTENHYRSAVARAYYAAYSKITHELVATAGLLMPPGREGPSHSRIRPIIETSMPNMAQEKRDKLSEMLGRLYALRIEADYRPSSEVEGTEAREAISMMKTIFEAF